MMNFAFIAFNIVYFCHSSFLDCRLRYWRAYPTVIQIWKKSGSYSHLLLLKNILRIGWSMPLGSSSPRPLLSASSPPSPSCGASLRRSPGSRKWTREGWRSVKMIFREIFKMISWEIFDPWLPILVSTLFTILLTCYTFRCSFETAMEYSRHELMKTIDQME